MMYSKQNNNNNILNGFIEITADKAKTRQRRLITISDNLQQWLNLGGELPVTNKRKRIAKLISYIGLNWKPDIMRHSFASYHLALHMSQDKTAFELGHRDTKCFLDITANWYQQRMHKNTGTLGRKRNLRLLQCIT